MEFIKKMGIGLQIATIKGKEGAETNYKLDFEDDINKDELSSFYITLKRLVRVVEDRIDEEYEERDL